LLASAKKWQEEIDAAQNERFLTATFSSVCIVAKYYVRINLLSLKSVTYGFMQSMLQD